MRVDDIIRGARSHIGERELPNNQGFVNKEFQRLMIEFGGWQPGWAWCMCFARMVWLRYGGFSAAQVRRLRADMHPGVLNAWRAFQAQRLTVSLPEPALIAIWRHGATAFGHAGIVTDVGASSFGCVEGNTNAAGSRNGDAVWERRRLIDFRRKANGLWLLGFLRPY